MKYITPGGDLSERLQELLRQPVRSSRDAWVAEEAARLLGELLRIEERAGELIGELAGAAPGGKVSDRAPAYGDLARLSLHEAAKIVLSEAGVPLHARELGERIKARGWRHPRSGRARPDQIVFQLAARLPKFPETFTRVAPNTFALTETPAQVERPKGRLGTFTGPGWGEAGVGDQDEQFEATKWRSS